MIRSVFGRVISSGRLCCQNTGQFTYQPSHQYLRSRSIVVSVDSPTPRFLFTWSNIVKQNGIFRQIVRKQCTAPPSTPPGSGGAPAPQKMSLFAKFKAMYKDYWYVVVPVHVVTSIGWFGGFYKVSTSGVDLGYYLRKIGVSENVVNHVTHSAMGHIAVAWALYKIATPVRYAVTLGGSTWSINVLRNMGYIKPAKVLMAKGRDKIQSLKDKKLPKN